MQVFELSVSGMNCGGCVNSVRTILSQKLDVDKEDVEVSLQDARARIQTEASPSAEQVQSALKALKERDFPARRVEA